MPSTTFTLDIARRSLLEKGVFDLNDSTVGERVLEMEQHGFPYLTEYGMEFANNLPLTNLGHWLRYEEFPGHVECFRRGGPKAGCRVLTVHLWAKGSRVEYYTLSHLHDLATTKGRRSLYEIPQSELDRVGSKPEVKDFPDGGLVILDARLGFQIERGYAITFLFATDEVIANWAKMTLPYSVGLEQNVKHLEMLSAKIGLNFKFVPSPKHSGHRWQLMGYGEDTATSWAAKSKLNHMQGNCRTQLRDII